MNDTTDETAPLGDPVRGPQHDAHTRGAFDHLDQLRRSATDRHVAGVAGGLGRHFGIAPTILRVLFVVLTFFGGAGLLLYGVTWLFVPEEGRADAPFDVSPDLRKAILVGAAIVAALLAIGDSLGGFSSWPLGVLVVILLGVYLVARDRRRPDAQSPAAHYPAAQYAAGQYPAGQHPVAPEEGTTMTTTYDDPARSGAATAPPSTADEAAGAPPSWQPPTSQRRPPRRPRRTGVIWFWPTLALIAIGLGVLGVYDADHAVAHGAYPALALTIIGVMLVVGSFRGRPGGLILLGILACLSLAASTAVGDSFGTDARQIHAVPTTAAAVQPAYEASVGQIELDLTQVRDPAELAGRSIDLDLRTGEIRVIVPRGLNVDVEADIEFAGGISVAGDDGGGIGHSVDTYLAGVPATDAAPLELDLEAKFGQITVEQR
jgi:phage shock protein PspC (stress-responsive transcriptional regulator)